MFDQGFRPLPKELACFFAVWNCSPLAAHGILHSKHSVSISQSDPIRKECSHKAITGLKRKVKREKNYNVHQYVQSGGILISSTFEEPPIVTLPLGMVFISV